MVSVAWGGARVVEAQQDPLEEARELYLSAELEAAKETLLEAENAGFRDRESYLSALALRALVLHGLGEEEDRDHDLERLALIAPDRELPDEAPPSLRRRYQRYLEQTEPMSLEVRPERTSDGVVLESVVSPEGTDVVDRVILFARLSPETSYRRGVERMLVETTPAGVLEYHAEALGPGGMTLITRGSDVEPLRFPFLAVNTPGVAEEPGEEEPGEEESDEKDDEGASPLPWILGGGAALVAGAIAIVLAFALTDSEDSFQVGGPMLEGE